MRSAIIADDLTGACDTAVQWARGGIRTSVLLMNEFGSLPPAGTFAMTTDSRADLPPNAFGKVADVARRLKEAGVTRVYKKVDSTLRGNIGAEMDALFEVYRPDFIIVAPSFPRNGRTVVNGRLLLHGVPVHETEAGRDLKTPVPTSDIAELIGLQSRNRAASVKLDTIRAGQAAFIRDLADFRSQQIPYIIMDASSESDLAAAVQYVNASGYSVLWSGSAGAAAYLAESQPLIAQQASSCIPGGPVAVLVGSVSGVARQQLQHALARPDVTGIALHSHLAVQGGEDNRLEIERVILEAKAAAERGTHPAIYTTIESKDMALTRDVGAAKGLSAVQIGEAIAAAMGAVGAELALRFGFDKWVMTGGDIARSVCERLNAAELVLEGEIEPGVPVGRLTGARDRYAVTKAGSFGSEHVLVKAIQRLSGG